MIQIDVQQIAYKTWNIEYTVWNEDGTRNRERWNGNLKTIYRKAYLIAGIPQNMIM